MANITVSRKPEKIKPVYKKRGKKNKILLYRTKRA
jgi:hypothetical protein